MSSPLNTYKEGCLPDDPNEALTSLKYPPRLKYQQWNPTDGMIIFTSIYAGQGIVSSSPKRELIVFFPKKKKIIFH